MSVHLVADLDSNKDRFITRVRETREVWGLRSDDGWAYCPSNQCETDVLLFWSDRAYASRHAVKEWSQYVPTPIALDDFIDGWLKGMHQDGLLVGTNFNAELAGQEVEPLELAHALV
jgi:hypothetical protein